MSKLESIKAISFDGDGTLWDFDKVMRHSLNCVLDELQRIDSSTAALLTIDRMIEIRNRVAFDLKAKTTNLEQVRLEAFRRTLSDVGRPNDGLAEHLNGIYLKHRFEDLELYDDVMPALRALGPSYKIGLVSNGNSYPERAGLAGVFRFVVFAQDHGAEKPDPRLFMVALEKAGCHSDEMLHVGDSIENDIAGARNAGIQSVWLNRGMAANSTGVRPDYEIASLKELLDLL